LGGALANARTKTLAKTEKLEIIRLIVPAGKELPEHKTRGALIVHCLEGRVALTALGKTQNLQSGQLLYLPVGEPHSVKGLQDASLLLTLLLPNC
jgi:quercetin dioxygenase-like cupin family protein